MNWWFSVGVFVTISLGWSTRPCLSWTFVGFRTKSSTSQEPSQSWQTRIACHPTFLQHAIHHHNTLYDQPVSALVWGGSLSTHTLIPHHMSWAEGLNWIPTTFMLRISNTLNLRMWFFDRNRVIAGTLSLRWGHIGADGPPKPSWQEGKCHVSRKAEMGVIYWQAKEPQTRPANHQVLGGRTNKFTDLGGSNCAHTLISDFSVLPTENERPHISTV